MKTTYFRRVAQRTPTQFWINNVTRREADLALAEGAVGCTQNPSYVWKMLSDPVESAYALPFLDAALRATEDDDEVVLRVQRDLVAGIARQFLPLWEASGGRLGYVSVQGDPVHESVDTFLKSARFNREAGPNIMAKVPLTENGLAAIRILLAEGTPINATEVMAVRQAVDLTEVYLEVCSRMRSPPIAYYSHITGIYDEHLQKRVAAEGIDISPDSLWQAGVIVAKKAYRLSKARCPAVGFIAGGARGLHHFTEMVGADAAVTINWKGCAEDLIAQDPPVVERFRAPVAESVLDELLDKLPDFRKGYLLNGIEPSEYEEFGPVVLFRDSFVANWGKALTFVKKRRAEIAR